MPGQIKRARLALILSTGALLFLVAVCWFVVSALRPQTRLPDGTVLVFEGVTYGTEHRHRSGPVLGSFLAPILPPELARRIGIREATLSPVNIGPSPAPEPPGAPRDFLVFWFRRTGPRSSRFQNRLGFTYNPSLPHAPTGQARSVHPGNASRDLEAWVVTSWDRRAPQIGLAREINGLKQPLRLVVSNPGRVVGSPPKVPPLPVKARDREVEVSLSTLVANVRDERLFAGRPPHRISVAILQTRDLQHTGRTWTPGQVDLTDTSGNWFLGHPPAFRPSRKLHRSLAMFPTHFPVDEPWEFRVELVQSGGYAPHQLWKVGPVVLPPRNQIQPFPPQRRYQFSGYRLLGITGRNVGRAFGVYSPEWSPSVYLQAPSRDAAITLLQATDQQQRPVKIRLSRGHGLIRAFSLMPDTHVRSVNLTLALQEQRQVTIRALPTSERLPDELFAGRRRRDRNNSRRGPVATQRAN